MATLNITEFSALTAVGSSFAPVAKNGKTPQDIVFTTTSVQSSALTGALIRVVSDIDCRIAIGASPTATTTGIRLIADQPEYFGINAGDKIAVIEG